VIGDDGGAKFTKGETVSLGKVLYEKLRVKQNWRKNMIFRIRLWGE
jgi:hypothetical protein